jgi:hypothetical protein
LVHDKRSSLLQKIYFFLASQGTNIIRFTNTKVSPIGKRTSLLRLGKKCFIAFDQDEKVFRLIVEKNQT